MSMSRCLLLAALMMSGCALFDEAELVESPDASLADASMPDAATGDGADAGTTADAERTDAARTDAGPDLGSSLQQRVDRWDPVAYYPFDTIEAGAYASRSARGVDRACVIDGDVTASDGILGGGALFSGGTCWIAHQPAMELSAGTIVVWMRPDFMADARSFLSKGSSETEGFNLANAGGYFTAVFPQLVGEDVSISIGPQLQAGQWYVLALSWSGEDISVWLDGDIKGTRAYDFTLVGNDEFLTVGANSTASTPGERLPNFSPFSGTLDELWVFDRELTTVEMQDLIRETEL